MIELNIPGQATVRLLHLVCDVNGTLAVDGQLIEGVAWTLGVLQDRLALHLLTADTHGAQDRIDEKLGLRAVRLQPGGEPAQKAAYVRQLGAGNVAAIGQGANDAAMLKEAAIGICVISPEGVSTEALKVADVVAADIHNALALLENPLRLVATLRT